MVNIDHVATIRQARRTVEPDPIGAAVLAELAGADGITVHLREDRRHIQDRDVRLLRQTVRTHLNLEMAATDEMVAIALDIRPDYVTLVPERREEVTTEGGLDVAGQIGRMEQVVNALQQANIPVSLFIDADPAQIDAAATVKAKFIELHTGRYAEAHDDASRAQELTFLEKGCGREIAGGIRGNARDRLARRNVYLLACIPGREETATNHSLKITAQSRANPTSWNPADPCWNRLESLRRDALVFGGRIILRYGGVGLSMPIFCGMKFAFKYPSRRNEGFRLIFVAFLNNTLPDSRKTPSSSVIPRNLYKTLQLVCFSPPIPQAFHRQ
ncbi:pyridoxine 5'-phosphate synthase [Leptolyngbya ohadii]|uniref:pyridoxine 5'-phosphate synthase n=1 Tax=Leptolyngbya ohadii TaxID=1962290 RepID=UPI0034E1EE13